MLEYSNIPNLSVWQIAEPNETRRTDEPAPQILCDEPTPPIYDWKTNTFYMSTYNDHTFL